MKETKVNAIMLVCASLLLFSLFAMNYVKPCRGSYDTPETTEDPGHIYSVFYSSNTPYSNEVTAGGSAISGVQGVGPNAGNYALVWNAVAVGPSVGGIQIPVDKFGLLAPYLGLASTAMIGAVATAVYVKRIKRRKEKQ